MLLSKHAELLAARAANCIVVVVAVVVVDITVVAIEIEGVVGIV